MASINTEEKIVIRVVGKATNGSIVPLDGGVLSFTVSNPDVAEVVDELGVPKLVGKAAGVVTVVARFSREGFEDLVATSEEVTVTSLTVATIEVTFGEVETK